MLKNKMTKWLAKTTSHNTAPSNRWWSITVDNLQVVKHVLTRRTDKERDERKNRWTTRQKQCWGGGKQSGPKILEKGSQKGRNRWQEHWENSSQGAKTGMLSTQYQFSFYKKGPCTGLLFLQLYWHPVEAPGERVPWGSGLLGSLPYHLHRTIHSIHTQCSPSICLLLLLAAAQECLAAG